MKIFENIGVAIPKILLPSKTVDLEKWAVVACDQYTSEPEYWKRVDSLVDSSSSTLRLIYPEVYLEEEGKEERIREINETMKNYMERGVFGEEFEGLILVERKLDNGKTRRGVMVAVDLEQYDFTPGSKALIKATEKTVLERIPPRVEIRKHATVELPHIMVLISDSEKKVIEGLFEKEKEKIYETNLMMNGGSILGWGIKKEEIWQEFADGLEKLKSRGEILMAVGDGNHSLATAKACYELNPTENSRFALVELVNIYDEGLDFEPIHRVIFNVDRDDFVNNIKGETEEIEIVVEGKVEKMRVKENVREVIDEYVKNNSETKIDYVHGREAVEKLSIDKNIGILLPPIDKSTFFENIVKFGVLPRKTFSMGEANDKRYYFEARRIR